MKVIEADGTEVHIDPRYAVIRMQRDILEMLQSGVNARVVAVPMPPGSFPEYVLQFRPIVPKWRAET